MIVRAGAIEILPPETAATARQIPNRAGERARIVKHLKGIVACHVEASARVGFPLGLPDVQAVVAALHAEADGLNPAAALSSPDAVIAHLRESLFSELVGEPSNIFFATQVFAEVMRYEALPMDFWRECLDGLLADLLAAPARSPLSPKIKFP